MFEAILPLPIRLHTLEFNYSQRELHILIVLYVYQNFRLGEAVLPAVDSSSLSSKEEFTSCVTE
jgi:hypothetical protein